MPPSPLAHAAHSQYARGAVLVAPARLIAHVPKACRLGPAGSGTLPPASVLLRQAVLSIWSSATRAAVCARQSAERALQSSGPRDLTEVLYQAE